MAARIVEVITDNLGKPFDPRSLPGSFAYDDNGNLLTETRVEAGSIVRVKSYTYVEINSKWLVERESSWINQTNINTD